MAEVSPGQDATAAQHNALYAARCPSGMIAMWSGTLATIPTGWYLCDGDNSTPNLLDRFILSVPDASTNPGTTGGAHTKTIATANLPSHTHTFTTGNSSSHTHSFTTGSAGSLNTSQSSSHGWSGSNLNYVMGTEVHDSNMEKWAHTHSGTTNAGGVHSHTGTTNATGSGSALDIRPKYYTLAFIMKS